MDEEGVVGQFIVNLILFLSFTLAATYFWDKTYKSGSRLLGGQRVEVQLPDEQRLESHQLAKGNDNIQLSSTGNNNSITLIKEQKNYFNTIKDEEKVNDIVNIPNVLGNEDLGKGLIMEGKRSNILEKDCIEKTVEKNPSKAKLEASPVAPDFKQAIFHLEPKDIVNVEFNGNPVLLRKDYTFSFIIFSKDQGIKPDILFTLQSDNGEVSSHFDFSNAIAYQDIKSKSIKTFRPQISNYFPEVPRFLKGKIRIANSTKKTLDVAIVLPVIEEGLFASTPVMCGTTRPSEALSYDSKGNLPGSLDNGGTISFMFSPFWHASRLTPGFDPHFFSWTDEQGKNGIKIIADSRDNGKIKAVITKDGKITKLSSDITPLKGEFYSVDFRFQTDRADLIIKENNMISAKNIEFPDMLKLGAKFFVGCNPFNEDEGAFSVIKNFIVFNGWLNNDEIKKNKIILSQKKL